MYLYFSQESFGAKLRLVEAVAKVTIAKPKAQAEWAKLVQRMKKAAQERNALAHFTAVADMKAAEDLGDMKRALAPAAIIPPELQHARKKKVRR